MSFDNAQLGNNTGVVNLLNGFYINEYLTSLGVSKTWEIFGFVENEPMSFADGLNESNKISNINLTDLGTPDGVTTKKGTYEGVWYFQPATGGGFNIPVPIRIEFSAIRTLY